MTQELDLKIAALLGTWHAPTASDDSVARLLAAAGAHGHFPDAGQAKAPRAHRFLLIGSALAATMLFTVIGHDQHDMLSKTEPLLQQSALSVFSVSSATLDADEVP
jgi:hypothetical protein